MRNGVWAGFILAGAMCSGNAYAFQIVAGPWLQNPSETSMTMVWMTDAECTNWVEYGTEDAIDRKAFSSKHGLIDANQTLHRITLEGLSPGTNYHYRVCSKEMLKFEPWKVTYGDSVAGDTNNFTTLSKNKDNISFIVLNDIHQRDDILTALLKRSAFRPYDLVFLNGDMLGHIDDEPQIVNHILKPCSELFAKTIPFIYVRGNHETRGKFARMLPNYLATPDDRYYYAFDHGPVHFIVLDGGEDKEDGHSEYSGLADFDRYRDDQKEWLQEDIQSEPFRRALYKIVLLHMPPGRSEKWHGLNHLYETWRPLFNQAKIDLMISGHTHQYAIVAPENGVHDFPVIIGGAPEEGRATVIRVDVTKEKLDVVMVTDDGNTVGTYQVNPK